MDGIAARTIHNCALFTDSDNYRRCGTDRTRWALRENNIRELFNRLQNHKSSLNLMLIILQRTFNHKIQESVIRLCGLVEQAVMSNYNLSVRLSCLEGNRSPSQYDAEVALTNDDRDDNSDSATIQPVNTTCYCIMCRLLATNNSQSDLISTGILMVSRVYTRVNFTLSDSHSKFSLTGSAGRLVAFSVFSSQSLAEICNLSVYSLPICLGNISNSNWYIDAVAC
jgi:hypothetical protein